VGEETVKFYSGGNRVKVQWKLGMGSAGVIGGGFSHLAVVFSTAQAAYPTRRLGIELARRLNHEHY
jgi:hypothetical protein